MGWIVCLFHYLSFVIFTAVLLWSVRLNLCLSVLFLIWWFLRQSGSLGNSLQHSSTSISEQAAQQLPEQATQHLSKPAHRHLEASLPLLDVPFWVKNYDVHLRHVEHPERHECTERHGNSQSGCLDEHLQRQRDTENLTTRTTDIHWQKTSVLEPHWQCVFSAAWLLSVSVWCCCFPSCYFRLLLSLLSVFRSSV